MNREKLLVINSCFQCRFSEKDDRPVGRGWVELGMKCIYGDPKGTLGDGRKLSNYEGVWPIPEWCPLEDVK